jgi:hypothetical protein
MSDSSQDELVEHKKFNRRLRLLLATSIGVLLVGAFLWLYGQQPNSWISLGIALVPNLLTALVAWLAVELVLASTGPSLADEVSKKVAASMSGVGGPPVTEIHGDVAGFQGLVDQLVADRIRLGAETVRITVVGYTGLTFFTSSLKGLVNSYKRNLIVDVHIIDFEGVDQGRLDLSWPIEAAEAVKLFRANTDNFRELSVDGLPTVPSILGIRVDDSDLFATFPYWIAQSGESIMLRQGNLTYWHMQKFPGRESPFNFAFELFDNWASSPGQRDLLAGS